MYANLPTRVLCEFDLTGETDEVVAAHAEKILGLG
jgi:hypothetical protein